MKKKNIVLILFASVLILTAGIESALAYFTTYTRAAGGYTVELKEVTTEIEESFSDWTKHISITSEADSEPVYVRARAFSGSQYELVYSGEGWTLGSDGYYYYSDILIGGAATGELLVKITNPPEDVDGSNFNVVVIYESTPVRYDENNNPYADWNVVLDSGRLEGEGEFKPEGGTEIDG